MSKDPKPMRERWESNLLKVQNELWKDPPLPSHLYHYSTIDAVRGILSSREMWLSDIRSMRGDASDGTYWINVFRSIIKHKSVPHYIQHLFQNTETFGLGWLWHTYVACFSAESELDYQWEHYADQGRGFAMEISFEALEMKCDGGKAYAWIPMLYDEHEQIVKAEKTIDAAIMLARDENMTAREAREYWVNDALMSFLQCGVRFKHPKFFREREWRVFTTRVDLNGVKYRTSDNNQQIAYLTLSLMPQLVTGLIKGSACTCSGADLAFSGIPLRSNCTSAV